MNRTPYVPTEPRAPTSDVASLRARLAEAEETLRAIGSGEVDALVGTGDAGASVYTLSGAGDAYRALIESMNEGALTLTTDKIILYANARFAEMVQRPLAQVIGASFKDLLAEADCAPLRALLENAGQDGSKVQLILHLGDGGTMPVLISVRCLARIGTDSRTVGMVVTDMTEQCRNEEVLRGLREIDARKEAETRQHESEERFRAALRVSEIRYRRLFEAAKDGILILDGQTGRITDANPYILEVLGLVHAEALGRELWEIGVFADAPASCAAMAELQERGYVRYDDLPLESKTGLRREVEVVANAYQENGHRVIQCNIRDITERKHTEQEFRFRDRAIAASDAGVFIVDPYLPDSPIVFASEGHERMTGYTAADSIGRNCRFLQGSGTDAAAVTRLREAVHAHQPVRLTLLNYRKDGRPFWNDVSISPVTDPQGRVTHLVGIQNDVSAQHELQVSLQASKDRLALGIKVAGFALAEVDYATDLNHLTAEAARAFGLGETAMEVPRASVHATFHPNDREELSRRVADSLDPAGPGWFTMDHRVVWPDGQVRWLTVRKQIFFTGEGTSRHPHRAILAVLDVTAEKAADAELLASHTRMQLATEATAVGIWERNVQTKTIRWDAQMFRLYGIAPTADGFVQYSDWTEAVLPEDLPENERIQHDSLRNYGHNRREFRIRRRDDGEVRDIEAVETVRTNDQGQAEWVLGTNLDITERNAAVESLRLTAEELARSARAKDDFLAALSHELRTPLTPVLMTASALASDPSLPPEVREQLSMMRRNIELEARLIDDLLDLTTISRGKLNLAPVITDLHVLLGQTDEIIRSDSLGKQVQIVLRLEAQRHHVLVDPARIQQVFWNLLKNAVKFTPSGGSISVSTTNDATGQIITCVKDNGIGMSAETQPHIFNAFEQGAIAGQHRYGGLGLGLAISQAIITAHKGAIRGESEGINCGSTFFVALLTIDAPAASTSSTVPGVVPTHTRKLLIIEDHETTRQVLQRLLTSKGHQVTTAGSKQEALAIHRTEHFDAVISDLGLPDGSGLDLMRELQRQRPVPGIALSGYGMDDDLQRSQEAGFFAHLVKPVKLDQLVQLLTQIPDHVGHHDNA